MTTPANPHQNPSDRCEDRRLSSPAGCYPATGQSATTTAAMRAAADLIDRSGIGGLSVTCSGGRISIQVPRSSGNTHSRAAAVARMAGYLGGTAVQDDNPAGDYSCIKAHGAAGGLPVEVFTGLTVQDAGTGPAGRRLLAADRDGRVAQVVPPARLPDGWRWLTDLDCPHPVAAAATPACPMLSSLASRP